MMRFLARGACCCWEEVEEEGEEPTDGDKARPVAEEGMGDEVSAGEEEEEVLTPPPPPPPPLPISAPPASGEG